MASKTKIKDRITAALKKNGGRMPYWKLADAVFPKDQYPHAWGSPNRGGPPGCYMALSRAIREHGFSISGFRYGVVHSEVSLGKNR